MSKIKKIEELSMLYDLYKNLLTENQEKIFSLYYFYDLSLSEISDLLKVSRTSILDNLKKTESKLLKYEDKLKFQKKLNSLLEIINFLETKKSFDSSEIIDKLKNILN